MSTFEDLMGAYQEGWASSNPALREQRSKEKRDLDMDTKKMQLAKQLEMQIWQMKEDYARQNPRYTQFKATPHGITGFSEYGETKEFPNSPEDQKILDKDREDKGLLNAARIKQAEAAADAAKENAASNRLYRQAAAQAKTRAAKPFDYSKALDNARKSLSYVLGPEPKKPASALEAFAKDPKTGKTGMDMYQERLDEWRKKKEAIESQAQAQAQQAANAYHQGGLLDVPQPSQQSGNPFDDLSTDDE